MNFTKICIIGLGYIGLPTASMFANNHLKVVGVDTNHEIIQKLSRGIVPIVEPGLQNAIDNAFNSGNLKVQEKPEQADAFIIAVPTPFYDDKKADMRYVASAAESILPYLKNGNLVVLESTSPPQTTSVLVKSILEKTGLKAGEDFLLAYSPERVLPGQILRELVENARVIGGINQKSAEAGRDLYRTFVKGEIILTDSTTAEMVKLMENTYRDVNIAIANEFSRLADRFDIDVQEAIRIANLHPRVKILNPGPGVGGHCISVDPWFLVEAAPDLAKLIRTAREVNDSQPHFVLANIKHILGDLNGSRICVLGLTFKPDVDDIRESPAVDIVRMLQDEGVFVSVYEPHRSDVLENIQTNVTLEDALKNSELILFLVGHSAFKQLNPSNIKEYTTARLVFDAVNIIGKNWDEEGFTVYRLGNKKRKVG